MIYQIITDATADLNDERLAGLPEISQEVLIGLGDSLDVAQELRDMIAARFPEAQIQIAPIGPVIGVHAGPGVIALFFWGSNH